MNNIQFNLFNKFKNCHNLISSFEIYLIKRDNITAEIENDMHNKYYDHT